MNRNIPIIEEYNTSPYKTSALTLSYTPRSHACWAGVLPLEPLYQPCFVLDIFEIGSCELYCPCWLQTTILLAGCRWLKPVILATQEAEIRRIKVQSQLRQIV
jgi:hypothetical protein